MPCRLKSLALQIGDMGVRVRATRNHPMILASQATENEAPEKLTVSSKKFKKATSPPTECNQVSCLGERRGTSKRESSNLTVIC